MGWTVKGCKNVKNAPNPSIQYLEDKTCIQNQTNIKYSSKPTDIFKSAKTNRKT